MRARRRWRRRRRCSTQRKTELEAKRKLIETGAMPKLELVNLEAQFKAAEAALAAAEAERERGVVRAPWDGIVTDVPVEVGRRRASPSPASEIAQMVALDPMLAVVEVSERKLAGIKVGDTAEIRLVTGETASGKHPLRRQDRRAQTTRTYRVEVEMPNADGAIPDGITAEVAIPLAPVPATRVPRSALTFSSGGELGVRAVEPAAWCFVPVAWSRTSRTFMWVGGIPDGARVIVQGQDFVREGQTGRAGRRPRRRRPPRASNNGKPQWPIPSTTPSIMRA